MNTLYQGSIFIFRLIGSVIIHIIIPSTHLVSLIAFHTSLNKDELFQKALYIISATCIIDTVQSLSLGTYAFAWVLTVLPLLSIKFIITRLYQPHMIVLQRVGYVCFLTISAMTHYFVAGLLNNRFVYPRISDYIITCIAAACIVLLTKHHET